jgi:hypothetical protein
MEQLVHLSELVIKNNDVIIFIEHEDKGRYLLITNRPKKALKILKKVDFKCSDSDLSKYLNGSFVLLNHKFETVTDTQSYLPNQMWVIDTHVFTEKKPVIIIRYE